LIAGIEIKITDMHSSNYEILETKTIWEHDWEIEKFNLLSFSVFWTWARILQISIPRNHFKPSTMWDNTSHPVPLEWYILFQFPAAKHRGSYNMEQRSFTSLQIQWMSLQASSFVAPSTKHHKLQPKMSLIARDEWWMIVWKCRRFRNS